MAGSESEIVVSQQQTQTAISNAEEAEEKESPREVGFYFWISRIRSIDLEHQVFEAEARLFLNWEITAAEYGAYQVKEGSYYNNEFVPTWSPNFLWANATLGTNELVGYRAVQKGDLDFYGYAISEPRVPYLYEAYHKVSGKFTIRSDLKNFPMDSQDLVVTLEMSDPLEAAVFVPSLAKNYDVGKRTACDITTKYSDLLPFEACEMFVEHLETDYGETWNNYSVLNFRVKVLREWRIYFWKVGIFMLSLSLASMVVYSMEIEDLPDKFNILITLFLAAIAFQYVVAGYLPHITYLTLLDKYILFCFLFLVVNAAIVAALTSIDDPGDYAGVEIVCWGVMSGVFVVGNAVFSVLMWLARNREKRKAHLDYFDMNRDGYIDGEQVGGEVNALKENIRLSEKVKRLLDDQKFPEFAQVEGKKKN